MDNIKNKEIELFNSYKKGNIEAKKELLSSLTPLITFQTNKFIGSGLPQIAINLEGKKLASQAIDSYDPKKAQLNTHVTNYLQKLSRFVTSYQNVGSIPEPRALLFGKYKTIWSNLETEKGREPTILELADAMNISVLEIERLQTELRNDLSDSVISADEDDSGGFYEYIAPNLYDPKLKEAIEFVYFDASPTDKIILEKTLGLYGKQKALSKEIAKSLNITDIELKKRKIELSKLIKELV